MVDPLEYPALKRSLFEQWDRETTQVNVVFAQGKTGTSSIAAGLKRAGFRPVFQVHTLAPRVLSKTEAAYSGRRDNSYPRHVWEAQWLGAHGPTEQHPWRLVASVRDPIARVVSRFFQQKNAFQELYDDLNAAALVVDLSEQFHRQKSALGIGYDWWEAELGPMLGQSVYDVPFDPAVGCGTIASDHIHSLLLRRESLDKAPEALRAHFGRPVELTLENVATTKGYGGLYRSVLDRFRPSPDYVAQVYETRQSRHFYSPAELDGFRQWWTRPVGPA